MRTFLLYILFLTSVSGLQAAEPSATTVPAPAQAAASGQEGFDLTTFLADRFAEEQRGTGWEERRRILIEYGAYVNPRNEVSLKAFRGGEDGAAQAIGRGKAGMVFHMLRKLAGEEQYNAAHREFIALAKFRRVSWDDVRSVFEKHSGRDLGWFFAQWLDEKGLPDLRVENAVARRTGGGFEVSFDVVQKGKTCVLDLPVTVALLRGGSKKETVRTDAEKKSVRIFVEEEPSKIVIDEDFDLARRLTPPETPPTIAALLGGEKPILVPPVSRREHYEAVIEALKRRGAEEKGAGYLKDAEIKSSSLVLLGEDNPVIARLYGTAAPPRAGFSVLVKRNPWGPGNVVGIVNALSKEEADAAWKIVALHGDSSSAAFERGKLLSKKTEDSPRGMQMELRQETVAVDLSALKTLTDVIEGAAGKKIVYVGEYHDKFAHHNVQLQVIKSLHKKDPRIGVGMEMFQRPFQAALDEYIAGSIDEREFLKRSEYFKRWGFDYNLYKPILDFCRAEKLPVVALNIRREITEKVSKSGLDSLTDEERKELPDQMDFSDEEYRKRLKQVFEEHKSSPGREFDFFYQAQVLWDETMAQSVDEFLRKRPDLRMAVIAGGGHLAHGSGIPKRVFRRNGREYAVIINDAEIERGVADFAVFPPPLEGATAPRLLVAMKEADGKVTITGFSQESPAEKAGLRTGDVILSLDGETVKDVGDVKLALHFKKSGDTLAVKALRKRFLFGEKEVEIAVRL